MDALEAIFTRRSIRKYDSGREVSMETVRLLLDAAMSAPSAGDGRPWHFVVVTDRKILDQEIPRIHKSAGFSRHAAAAIVVCGDPSDESYGAYWQQDCAAAVQNILLAAHAEGLGACWCGIHPQKQRTADFSGLFGIPEPFIPLAVVTLGYPAERKPKAKRYDPDRVHQNKW